MLPLEGVLVIALEQAVAAPMCTLRLADAGARVIKVERAEGETARHYDKTVLGTSAYFAWLNRGKESAVLDIKQAGDRALLERMVARAAHLVAVDLAGYPSDSSYRDMRAYDMLIQAEAGICSVTGTPDDPVKVGVSMADVATGMNAHAAILEALLERGKSGQGRALEITMFDAMADMMSVPLLHHDYAARDTPRTGLAHASIYPYGRVDCLDGSVVIVVQNPGEWLRLCEGVLVRPDLVDDPRFADNPSRVANREALDAILKDTFSVLSRDEAIGRLEANRLAWANVSTVADLSGHPALRRVEVETPGGAFGAVGSPVRREIRPGPVPALGAHTEQLRREFAEERT